MSLVTTQNLSKSFDPVDIFTGLTLSIPPGARIALVGANGIGKTTLLRDWAALLKRPVGWITLDDGDNDWVRFIQYLIRAFQVC